MKLVNTLNNKLKDNTQFRLVLILCGLLLIAIREPAHLLFPRLWAEEGCIFYQFALHHSLYDIFFTAHVGYLTLFNSIVSALQAKVFSVENAAIVSTYLGFLVQLTPVYIIAFTTNKFWDNPPKKIITTFMIIIVTAPEISLNTTNSHFVFGFITFLIMVISTDGLLTFQKYFFRFLLFIGGLTGPASVLFTPLFIYKAYIEKKKEKYIQACILIFCAITQMSIILYALFFNNNYNRLSNHNYKHTLYSFFVDNFSILPHTSTSYLHPILFYLSILFSLMMLTFYIYLFLKNKTNTDYLISLAGLLIVGVISTLGSLNMAGSPRYAYIPGCIFILLIINESFKIDVRQTKLKYVSILILFLCFTANTVYYRYGMRNVYNTDYPKWASEVAKWRIDNTYSPKIHPGTYAGQCVKL